MEFFLALASNVDNFAVAIAYGVKKAKIGFWSNLAIAIVSTLGTYISMAVGARLATMLYPPLASFLGSIFLVAMGICGIFSPLDTKEYETDNPIGVRESIFLSFALSINNVFSGVGAGLAGLNVGNASAEVFIISILGIELGYLLGDKFTTKIPRQICGIMSGFLITAVGIYEYFN